MTSGSTGIPLEFVLDNKTVKRERAHFLYFWNKYGFKKGRDRCILLRGQYVANLKENILFEYDIFAKYKRFDSEYITEKQYAKLYKIQMEDFDAHIMQAYPSSAYNLARMFDELGIDPPHFDSIFLGSENVYTDQIDYIKKRIAQIL